jgi:hypothetical protein
LDLRPVWYYSVSLRANCRETSASLR